ncbi:DUF4169 family protein [Sphingomonas mollis]|uniref:DUF4169 family protein n=1 Tax=Sphingomonas mollis TaxID=2795726 RepID=A0ABS0XMY3_9SPHN|nr:DUF4169 family protein [Sphingomonas sp. BT553]MBJ6121384.1 DUF4169 family protein [Sphingomonas sp. BT553]
MAEIVNLRTVRKAKARDAAAATADANRIAHGRTKAEKQAARIEADRARRLLDGAKLDD